MHPDLSPLPPAFLTAEATAAGISPRRLITAVGSGVVERLDRHHLDHGWRELPVNSVFEVHDGVITVWRDYFDLPTAAKIHDAGAV